MDQAVIIFTKNPEAGKVKTRLAATIGDERALDVYLFLLNYTRSILTPLKGEVQLFVYYDQQIEESDDWDLLNPVKRVQQGADLGARMNHAFKEVFDLGYKKALLIGTDIYQQTTQNLQIALQNLDRFEVVVQPVYDGGYCLIGLKSPTPKLFLNKHWSHAQVMQELEREVSTLKKSIYKLPPIIDVDDWEDFKASGLTLEMINEFIQAHS